MVGPERTAYVPRLTRFIPSTPTSRTTLPLHDVKSLVRWQASAPTYKCRPHMLAVSQPLLQTFSNQVSGLSRGAEGEATISTTLSLDAAGCSSA